MRKNLIIPTIVMLACGLAGCSKSSPVNETVPVPVLAAQAVVTNVPVRIDPPPVGHVMPFSSVTIRPQIGGIISRIHFQEGQEVKQGDLLFTIDPRPAQAALEAARAALARDTAQLRNAKIQFDREQKLFDQKLVSQDEFDTSRATLDELTGSVAADQSQLTNAQLNLEFTAIRAPFDGRTGSLQFHEGNVVKAPDDTLLTINQIHPIYVVFAVAERYLPVIQREMAAKPLGVSATYENLAGPPPHGELTFIDNSVDVTTGTIELKATFANPDGVLWPGQFVQVALTLSELTNAVVVPSQAVQNGQNGQFVYVVKADQTVEQRPIKSGITLDSGTVVETGLSAGETVVTDGQLRLAPGVKVSVSGSRQPVTTSAPTNAP